MINKIMPHVFKISEFMLRNVTRFLELAITNLTLTLPSIASCDQGLIVFLFFGGKGDYSLPILLLFYFGNEWADKRISG